MTQTPLIKKKDIKLLHCVIQSVPMVTFSVYCDISLLAAATC